MHLPDECLVEHKETEGGVGNERTSPTIIGTVKTSIDLVQVVRSSHAPFPHVILEDVAAPAEFIRVALGLGL